MDDEELRDLQERVQLIEDMAATPGWMLLLDAISQNVEVREQALVHGAPDDFTEYQKLVGYLNGVRSVTSLPVRLRVSLDEEMAYRAEVEAEEEEDAA